jgi:hypothetical protein
MVFLRWLLVFTIVAVGSFVLVLAGFIDKVNAADATKITFAIYIVFMLISLRVGFDAWRLRKGDAETAAMVERRQETGWFVSDTLVSLGLIGTVLGFILMLGVSFSEIKFDSPDSLRAALVKMGGGMSTALYTTAAGQICSVILNLQLFLVAREIDHVLARK